jgi:hypothetical protein
VVLRLPGKVALAWLTAHTMHVFIGVSALILVL